MFAMTVGDSSAGKIPEGPEIGELRQLLREAPPTCWLAFRRLAEVNHPSALQILVAETKHPDEYRRRAAAEALGRSPLGADAVGDVRRLLTDSSPYVVRAALAAAATLRDDHSHEAVLRHLNDGEAATRHTALRALDALWRDEDSAAVLALASNDPDSDVRKEAGWLLRHHVPPDPRPLLKRWLSSEIPRERVWAAELMRISVAEYDRASLDFLLRDTDGHVREAAKRTLSAIQRASGPLHAIWMAPIHPADAESQSDTTRRDMEADTSTEKLGEFPWPDVVFIDDDKSGWFLFRYTLAGRFAGDTWHESLEHAKAQASDEYGSSLGEWIEVPGDMNPIDFARQQLTAADGQT
jgi:hypothetical protein